jgi:hypothetical protein
MIVYLWEYFITPRKKKEIGEDRDGPLRAAFCLRAEIDFDSTEKFFVDPDFRFICVCGGEDGR